MESEIKSTSKKIEIDLPEENWTKFPNNLLYSINQFTLAEYCILSVMVRENFKRVPNDKFSISFFESNTGLSRPTIIKSIKGLLSKSSIKKIKTGSNTTARYIVNWRQSGKNSLLAENPTSKNSLPQNSKTSKESLPQLVKNFYPDRDITFRQENKDKERDLFSSQEKKELNYNQILDQFFQAHKEVFGEEWTQNKTFYIKEMQALKRLVKQYGAEIVLEKLEIFIMLVKGSQKFWNSQPIQPTRLETHFSSVLGNKKTGTKKSDWRSERFGK